MGVLEDVHKNKRNIYIASEAILTANTSFIAHYQDFLSLVEQLETKVKELELREVAVKQLEAEVFVEKENLQIREQKVEIREREVSMKEERWKATEKRMEQNAAKLPTLVHFNVSGTKFAVTKERLLQHKGSLFEHMVHTDHSQQMYPSGEIFIERDPTYFMFVIRFLLSGTLQPPENIHERKKIEEEFAYFQIPCQFPPTNNKQQPNSPQVVNQYPPSNIPPLPLPGYFVRDNLFLLGDKFFGTIARNWFPAKQFKLLYKACVDGFDSAVFHKKCDHTGPTLTVICSSNGYVFGGYTPLSWDCSDNDKNDPSMFIFTLSNPLAIPPTKYLPMKNTTFGIRCHENYGPYFGDSDIVVRSNSNATKNFTDFPGGYLDITGKGEKTFTGAREFIAKDIEVFSVL